MSGTSEVIGRKALVTGSTKGIGKAVAARLREAGTTVLTTARMQRGDFADADLFVAADITTVEGSYSPWRHRHHRPCRWRLVRPGGRFRRTRRG
jgi:NAD(P)-dependent dehydrogenase (short-subunit alcohol dehydrogenase family)